MTYPAIPTLSMFVTRVWVGMFTLPGAAIFHLKTYQTSLLFWGTFESNILHTLGHKMQLSRKVQPNQISFACIADFVDSLLSKCAVTFE